MPRPNRVSRTDGLRNRRASSALLAPGNHLRDRAPRLPRLRRTPGPSRARSPGRQRQAGGAMNANQLLVVLLAATAVLPPWAAFFATRADCATRRAMKSWDTGAKPIPKLVLTGQASAAQASDTG